MTTEERRRLGALMGRLIEVLGRLEVNHMQDSLELLSIMQELGDLAWNGVNSMYADCYGPPRQKPYTQVPEDGR